MELESADLASCLYFGRVSHARRHPASHAFRNGVCAWLIDLGETEALARRLKLFSVNRANVFSFYDRDHGPRDGSPLRPWVDGHLAAAGLDLEGGPVRILCFPRLFGYVFNPLSVWYCHRPDGRLAAALLEVSNIAGQSHNYLVPAAEYSGPNDPVEAGFAKRFHVSAFITMNARYECRVARPGRRLAVNVRESAGDRRVLTATWIGRRRDLTSSNLARALARYPLMTFKISAAIYWHALQLVRKGVPRHPLPPIDTAAGVTYVPAADAASQRRQVGKSGEGLDGAVGVPDFRVLRPRRHVVDVGER